MAEQAPSSIQVYRPDYSHPLSGCHHYRITHTGTGTTGAWDYYSGISGIVHLVTEYPDGTGIAKQAFLSDATTGQISLTTDVGAAKVVYVHVFARGGESLNVSSLTNDWEPDSVDIDPYKDLRLIVGTYPSTNYPQNGATWTTGITGLVHAGWQPDNFLSVTGISLASGVVTFVGTVSLGEGGRVFLWARG